MTDPSITHKVNALLQTLRRQDPDGEMADVYSHPAIREFLERVVQSSAPLIGLPPVSFRMLIQDWDEQQVLEAEKYRILSRQIKHILKIPGYVIEYCRFNESMRTPPKPEPKRPTNLLELFVAIISAFEKEPERPPQLTDQQLKDFFDDIDKQLTDIITANPDAELTKYERTLSIHILSIDRPKPPPQPKPIKGFIT